MKRNHRTARPITLLFVLVLVFAALLAISSVRVTSAKEADAQRASAKITSAQQRGVGLASANQAATEEAMVGSQAVEVRWANVANKVSGLPQQGIDEEDHIDSDIDPATLEMLKRQPYQAPASMPSSYSANEDAEAKGAVSVLAPNLVANFESIDDGDQLDGFLHRPPDCSMAAGLNHVTAAVNSMFVIYNKSGGNVSQASLGSFFSPICSGCNPFDPRVAYDSLAGRWILICVNGNKDTPGVSNYLVAASQTSDPTGTWWVYSLSGILNYPPTGENTWADFPQVGFDGITSATGGAVYISSNQFTFGSSAAYRTAVLNILPKSSLYSGAALNYWRAWDRLNSDGSQVFTLSPALTYGNPGSHFLINTKNGGNFVSLWKVIPTYPPTPVNWTLQSTNIIGAYALPPDAAQPGACELMATNDCRISTNSVWRNNRIYLAFAESHDWGGGGGTVSAIRFVQINTSTSATEQNTTYGADGFYYFFPAVATDSASNVVLTFARCNSSEFGSVRFTGRLVSDPPNTFQGSALLKGGNLCITGGRWGDYFSAAVDPTDSSKVWIYGAWAANVTGVSLPWDWGTWIGQVQFGATGGTDTIGLFRPSGNFFFLRNSNTTGSPDITVPFGTSGDIPIVGDWDGNGTTTIGLYRQSTSTFFLRNSNTIGFPDITVAFGDGPGGDVPIVGDWDGNGTTTIGVYRPSTSTFFLRNSNTAGFPDISVSFGAAGDLPIVGDWDGNGTTTIGLYRPSGSIFYLRNSNTTGFPDLSIPFGASGDLPIVGDWDGNGTTTIGLYRPSGSIFFLRNSNTTGFPDLSVPFGASGDKPLAGDWDGQ